MTFASSNPLSPAMQSVSTGMRRNEGGVSDEQKRRSLRGPNRDVRAATIRRSGQPTRASAPRMRAFDQDLSFSASYMLGCRGAGASGRCLANQQWLALLVVVAIIGLIASVTYWQQLSAAVKFLAGH